MKNAEQVEGLVDEREQAATEALLRWRRRVCYGMTEILPNLYLGSMRDANDADQLNEKQIQYIVSIHGLTRSPTTLSNSNASVLHIHMADLPEANISEHFQEAITFIHHARLQNSEFLTIYVNDFCHYIDCQTFFFVLEGGTHWRIQGPFPLLLSPFPQRRRHQC
ncbi:unnamed protein product [Gongylonema pulchrum]|uniref:DSPc domain-containing protein n=1 Tax=Gongylonema pulchrum TaxID=637853 RepID=A0A183E274_9BILA|nr:unnamed protein product [Gongylonema pulchrum]